MLTVLPDTNVLFGGLYGGSSDAAWQRLLGLSAARELDLVLPEIVQWELVNQLREGLAANVKAFKSLADKLRRVGMEPPTFGEGDAQAAEIVAAASERLRDTVLWHHGRFAEVPCVLAAELTRRSLERRLPFDQQDRGMRDTLLWLTALEVAAGGDTVILVTNDRRAFGEIDLHTQLREEVAVRCGDASRIVLASDLTAALRIALDRTSAIRQTAEQAFSDADLLAEAMHSLAEAAEGEILDDRSLATQGWPRELVGVRVLAVDEFTSAGIDRVDEVPDGRLRARLRVGAKAHLDARHDPEIEFNDWTDLVEGADVTDVGRGLIDPWVQVHMRRAVDLLGDVVLSREGPSATEFSLAGIELPRRPLPQGQLRLEILP